ncbi:hypothetical protein K435DRAFT_740525 [Dendrothele bispora CBS 962.96]|uniref:Gfd2/YDR514C-like C-terminal domain-containing protein n=1 Tax=Dendrothele bispora (strain CBS 962.96) TaxID=1314807 RepID=A0A4S8N078_DENBC|nr:hypothetical protein K435DRAFT_740525 [Dendrothele bispora CBS 962.96]
MTIGSPIITGYYRYTDIWFEWAEKRLPNPGDRDAVKAILAHDALVHVEHPLRLPDQDGAQLFLGSFPNGEKRLMFSSKQIDYIRYWLHAMKLTPEIIPLPYSDCLLLETYLRGVEPVTFKTGGDLKKFNKDLDKLNKKLKKSAHTPTLENRRQIFDRSRGHFLEKKNAWLAIDFEGWERDHTVITEFGWSALHWENGQEILEDGHLIIEENKRYTNGTFVRDNRDRYSFGTSETLTKAKFKEKIHALLARMKSYGAVYLVFHDNAQDIKYLKSSMISAPIEGLSYDPPLKSPTEGLFVIDTSDLFAALEGEGSSNRRGLERMCSFLKIPTQFLHNAGNDAHYTLLACKEMISGEPLDQQRERRWPDRTNSGGVQVQWQPWEVDSDYSDEEGLI